MPSSVDPDKVDHARTPTLSWFIMEKTGDYELAILMNAISLACKAITRAVRKAGKTRVRLLAGSLACWLTRCVRRFRCSISKHYYDTDFIELSINSCLSQICIYVIIGARPSFIRVLKTYVWPSSCVTPAGASTSYYAQTW